MQHFGSTASRRQTTTSRWATPPRSNSALIRDKAPKPSTITELIATSRTLSDLLHDENFRQLIATRLKILATNGSTSPVPAGDILAMADDMRENPRAFASAPKPVYDFVHVTIVLEMGLLNGEWMLKTRGCDTYGAAANVGGHLERYLNGDYTPRQFLDRLRRSRSALDRVMTPSRRIRWDIAHTGK